MENRIIRVLLLADTHLGFDLPFRPRVVRRRRGPDFFANFRTALRPALHGEVDFVVHGGDLLYRSKVPPALIDMAMAPLLDVAERGVPVYMVPGNHERSRIPLQLCTDHKNIRIFDRPRTFLLRTNGTEVALSGFPFVRRARSGFAKNLEETGFRDAQAGLRLLCLHQVFEGAQVGASNFTFRGGPDVIRGADIPDCFSAVLCGHIHRAQILTLDLGGKPLPSPVLYPGSIERTSIAERNEKKGYYSLAFSRAAAGAAGRHNLTAQFKDLQARPMTKLVLRSADLAGASIDEVLEKRLSSLDPESVVRVSFEGPAAKRASAGLSAKRLREIAPLTMNVTLSPETWRNNAVGSANGGTG